MLTQRLQTALALILLPLAIACGSVGAGANADADAGADASDTTSATSGTTTSALGTGKVTGSVEGHTMTVGSASFALTSGANGNTLILFMSDQADFCAKYTNGTVTPSQILMGFGAYQITASDDNPAVSPGAYTIINAQPTTAGSYAEARFYAVGTAANSCNDLLTGTDDGVAASGTLTVETVSESALSATFSLVIESSTLTGTAAATYCPALATSTVSDLTCSAD